MVICNISIKVPTLYTRHAGVRQFSSTLFSAQLQKTKQHSKAFLTSQLPSVTERLLKTLTNLSVMSPAPLSLQCQATTEQLWVVAIPRLLWKPRGLSWSLFCGRVESRSRNFKRLDGALACLAWRGERGREVWVIADIRRVGIFIREQKHLMKTRVWNLLVVCACCVSVFSAPSFPRFLTHYAWLTSPDGQCGAEMDRKQDTHWGLWQIWWQSDKSIITYPMKSMAVIIHLSIVQTPTHRQMSCYAGQHDSFYNSGLSGLFRTKFYSKLYRNSLLGTIDFGFWVN